MKQFPRLISLFLALCLGLGVIASASAEQGTHTDIFTGMLDRIAFELPGSGCTILEGEYPGMFEDARQIYGHSDDGEFTLRTAKIGGWVAGMLEHYPDEDPYHVRANTLIQFAVMIISSYDGEPTDMRAHDGGEYVSASFRFTYPDTPGVDYEGAAILNVETGRAVTVYGECGETNSAAIAALRFVSEEEATAFAETRAPEELDLGEVTVTFPVRPITVDNEFSQLVGCLTDGFDYLAVQVFPGMTIEVSDDDAQAKADLLKAAERVILPTIGNSRITESELTRPAPGVAVLTITCPDPYFGVTNYRCALCIGREYVYYVWSTESEAGQAFLDGFVWTE